MTQQMHPLAAQARRDFLRWYKRTNDPFCLECAAQLAEAATHRPKARIGGRSSNTGIPGISRRTDGRYNVKMADGRYATIRGTLAQAEELQRNGRANS